LGGDSVRVQRSETSWRAFGGPRVRPSDLDVESADSLADFGFVGKLPDPLDFGLDLAK